MEIIDIVKMRNGITTNSRDNFIQDLIKATKGQLQAVNGITLDEENDLHKMFIADYVSWRYDNQGDDRMPAYLRLQLNELWNMQHELSV